MLIALTCPACAGPLPRSARWLTTRCPYCGATVSRGERKVEAARYRAALAAFDAPAPAADTLQFIAQQGRGGPLRVRGLLGQGARGPALWVERPRPLSERLVLRLAPAAQAHGLDAAATVLRALAASEAPGATTFTRGLPRVEAQGGCEGAAALLLSYPPGFSARLDLLRPDGGVLDPRHLVWIGKRILELLHFVHLSGWVHGGLHPAHALLHPRDHGVWLVGWSGAQAVSTGRLAAELRAWAALLMGVAHHHGVDVPAQMGAVLRAAAAGALPAGDQHSAWALRQVWAAAAQADFGPPAYVRLDLAAPPTPSAAPLRGPVGGDDA